MRDGSMADVDMEFYALAGDSFMVSMESSMVLA
jgi:hypothetical protein